MQVLKEIQLLLRLFESNIELTKLENAKQLAREQVFFVYNMSITPYGGKACRLEVESFINEIKQVCEPFDLLDEQLIYFTGRNLTGMAKEWYTKYMHRLCSLFPPTQITRISFEIFLEEFREHFLRNYDIAHLEKLFEKYHQTGKVENFSRKFLKYFKQTIKKPWPQGEIVRLYISKLRPSIASDVEKHHPNRIVEAMAIALGHKDANIFDNQCDLKEGKRTKKAEKSIDIVKNHSRLKVDRRGPKFIYNTNCISRLLLLESIISSNKTNEKIGTTKLNLTRFNANLANEGISLGSEVSNESEISTLSDGDIEQPGESLSQTNSCNVKEPDSWIKAADDKDTDLYEQD